MKSAQIFNFGSPDVFEIVETPTPSPGPGQVLVRIYASGINFAETLMRRNMYALSPTLPATLGSEAAGCIEAIGRNVNGLVEGMRVAVPLFATGTFFGGYADYVLVDANILVPIPHALSYEQATALMVQGLTALYLINFFPPQGKSVLVSAAAGGVGSLLVQLLRHAHAKTIIAAAGSSSKLEFARSLGADVCINYTHPDWARELDSSSPSTKPDIIYESVGGSITSSSLTLLAPQGTLVIYGALNIQEFQMGIPELREIIFKNQSIAGFALTPLLTLESMKLGLHRLFDLTARELLRVTIGGIFPLEQVGNAHRAIEERQTMGKIVLAP